MSGSEDTEMIENGGDEGKENKPPDPPDPPDKTKLKDQEIFLYENKDEGPFYVFIESMSQVERGVGRMHPMTIGKTLKKLFPTVEILKLIKNGINRIKIEVKSRSQANEIIQSETLKKENLKAYVPKFILFRQGIIRNVDTSLTVEDLLEEIKPLYSLDMKVSTVRRFTRKITNTAGEAEYLPTGTIHVTFRGQVLPTHVSIYYVRCEVEKYIPKVTQCAKCLRFGHHDENCRGNFRCSICSEQHKDSECTKNISEAKCVHCQGPHSSRVNFKNPVCPEFIKQKSIKNLMATENITFIEAKEKIASNYSSLAARTKNTNVSFNEPSTSNQSRGQIRRLSGVRSATFSPTTPERNVTKKRMRQESPRNEQFLQQCRDINRSYQYQPNQFPNGVCLTEEQKASQGDRESAKCTLEFENLDKLTQFICTVFKNSSGLGGGKRQITQTDLQKIIQDELVRNNNHQEVEFSDMFSSGDDDELA